MQSESKHLMEDTEKTSGQTSLIEWYGLNCALPPHLSIHRMKLQLPMTVLGDRTGEAVTKIK